MTSGSTLKWCADGSAMTVSYSLRAPAFMYSADGSAPPAAAEVPRDEEAAICGGCPAARRLRGGG